MQPNQEGAILTSDGGETSGLLCTKASIFRSTDTAVTQGLAVRGETSTDDTHSTHTIVSSHPSIVPTSPFMKSVDCPHPLLSLFI